MSASVNAMTALPSANGPVQYDPPTIKYNDEETDHDSTDSDGAQLPQPQPQPQVEWYRPPKPDANTFKTQEAFLESLEPMNIEDVGEGNRKCPICWKPFGEAPDPGFDNSEVPVQLRCKHIFGYKCLNSVFAVRKSYSITLQPLQFSPGTMGSLLGEMLLKCHQVYIAKSRSEAEMFENLLEIQGHHPGEQSYFGVHWSALIDVVLSQDSDLLNITFMENAVIMDHYTKKPLNDVAKLGSTSPQYLNGSSPLQYGHGTGMSSMSSTLGSPPTLQSKTLNFGSHLPGAPQASHPDSWQVALANETNLDKLTALQKKFNDTKNPKVGKLFEQKVDALKMQADREEQLKQRAQSMREIAERRARDRNTLLARKLIDILAQHKTYKSLHVANTSLPNTAPDKVPDQIEGWVRIHKHTMADTSHVITPPWVPDHLEEEEVDEDTTTSGIAKSIFVVERTYCNKCIDGTKSTAATPSELTWKSRDKIPDDCPLCHKVLFKESDD